MKHQYAISSLFFILSFYICAQSVDKHVDMGEYTMHFKIIKGEGTPILFEAGGGDDSTVWDPILQKIHDATGATLISYDRSGFGKSELNPKLKNEADFGIENGIKELEAGLSKLGYTDKIMLVSHSYGGLYNLLYARKHPKKVTALVLIDVTLSDFWNEELLTMRDMNIDISAIPKPSGDYYMNANFNKIMRDVRGLKFPESMPILNIFPENSFPGFPEILSNRWRELHQELGAQNQNITNSIAKGSSHGVFQDNPALVINAINKMYAETLDKNQQNIVLKKALAIAMELAIETKSTNRSENDLIALGYSFLGNAELDKALEVFKVNIALFPESSNAYDSYGEALLIADQKPEAIEMYTKSIELDPNNENAKAVLLKMKEE
ncbi:alpha/beta fold hydrolase [Cellulophaga sp. Z1A5H]|uniref:alpha/beta fold hydrolase n=1 Tax=Cellulophaga sp. Z1A5H TaxID=2687291 RepID=UPI0013FDD73F|nr:alpha/beta hydrolase [Cellulophaga sp. Z1A5H]